VSFEQRSKLVSEEAWDVLVRKQSDYGPKNIMNAPGGALNGLAVRLHDKVARLANMMDKDINDHEFESLRDTFLDIANYGLIGMMVLDQTFEVPNDK
jgi:hypothetical protein